MAVDVLTATPLSIDKLREQFQWFERFKKEILAENDWVDIQDKRFLKKSAWRKIALAFGVSDELVSYRRVPTEGRDKDGNFYYEVVTRAFHLATGRTSTGVAIASWNEKKSWSHGEHDIFTLAATRSKNRSISDLVGGGEVSAEEMTSDDTTTATIQTEPVETRRTASWHVPTTKDFLTREGLKQYPLGYGNKSVGTSNIDEINHELAFIPESRIKADSSPMKSFLVGRIFSAMKEKHGVNFDYYLDVDADGFLKCALVRMTEIEAERLKELSNACGWAFQKASETKS